MEMVILVCQRMAPEGPLLVGMALLLICLVNVAYERRTDNYSKQKRDEERNEGALEGGHHGHSSL